MPGTPPIAEPKMIPTRVGSKPFRPASASASRRRGDAEQDVALELARLLRRDDLRRVEALHLAGDPHGQPVGVEGRDPVDAALAGDRGAHVEGTSRPSGVTAPTPVTATRLIGQA